MSVKAIKDMKLERIAAEVKPARMAAEVKPARRQGEVKGNISDSSVLLTSGFVSATLVK